jgi:predicted Zn-dependent protease
MKYVPRLPEENVNVSPTPPVREFLLLAGGVLAVMLGVYLLLGFAVDWVVPHISYDLEKKWGSIFVKMMKGQTVESPAKDCVQDLLDSVQQECVGLPYGFRVHLSRRNDVNAVSLPGGNIVVFSGLLKRVSSENELAFVLAHELGHYVHRDHLRGLGRGLVLMALSTLILGPESDATNWLARTLNLAELHFSRQQEMRADEFALEALNCRYGHVGGANDFFQMLPKEKDPGRYGQYFATHPHTWSRIEHIRAVVASKGWKELDPNPLAESCRP